MSHDLYDRFFGLISDLVLCHSPSGVEHEIDAFILGRLERLSREVWQDAAGNIVAKIPGENSGASVAITAHKDEIAALVKRVRPDGRVEVRRLGGAFPWVYGEGVVDLLGDAGTVSGILSFGSRHVSHESPQKLYEEDRPPRWETVWVETKLSPEQLRSAGVRVGTRVVVGRHRKAPFRLGEYIASYTLDNKGGVAVALLLAERLQKPARDVYLVFTAKEEVGAIGGMYFTREHRVDELIALEISPKSVEYPIHFDDQPVLVSQDGYGLYDEGLNGRLERAAREADVAVQRAVLAQFGSDASIAMKSGHVPRAACLGFPADNSHGYEIVHLEAFNACLKTLDVFCRGS